MRDSHSPLAATGPAWSIPVLLARRPLSPHPRAANPDAPSLAREARRRILRCSLLPWSDCSDGAGLHGRSSASPPRLKALTQVLSVGSLLLLKRPTQSLSVDLMPVLGDLEVVLRKEIRSRGTRKAGQINAPPLVCKQKSTSMCKKPFLFVCLIFAFLDGGCGRSPMEILVRVGAGGMPGAGQTGGTVGFAAGGDGGTHSSTGGQHASGGSNGGGGTVAMGGQGASGGAGGRGGIVAMGGQAGLGGVGGSFFIPYALQGEMVTLASGQAWPSCIAINSSDVYWENSGRQGSVRGSIMKVPLGGGAATLVSPGSFPGGVAVDSTNVYWSTYSPSAEGLTLMKMPLVGGAATTLAIGFMNSPIAVGPLGVYGTGQVDGGTTIVSAPLAGGAPTALVPASSLPQTFSSYGIAVDAISVYWTTFSTPGTVMKAPLAGGNPTTLGSAPGSGYGIAIDATSVYWITSETVTKVALNGGTPVILAPTGGQGIAVDDANVYWTDFGNPGSVSKVSINGGAATVLATNLQRPAGIAVDATSVYWVNSGDGDNTGYVMKLTPK
jgi:hypothetical protein